MSAWILLWTFCANGACEWSSGAVSASYAQCKEAGDAYVPNKLVMHEGSSISYTCKEVIVLNKQKKEGE